MKCLILERNGIGVAMRGASTNFGGAYDCAGKILVIDDEASCRFLLTEWLRGCGYECHEATNGSEGLNALWMGIGISS
jgi:PleD family two-component response regulator